MRNGIKYSLAFVLGAAAGAVGTWFVLNKKYEQLVREEVASVKKELFEPFDKSELETAIEHGQMIIEGFEDGLKDVKPITGLEDVRQMATKLQEEGYLNYAAQSEEKKEEKVERPYVISPDEFGELYEYETNSLFYHADGVVADAYGNLVEDVEDVVGLDSLNHFGEYEDDSVFVRNDRLRADYEILLDPRRYSEVVNTKPHQAEDE